MVDLSPYQSYTDPLTLFAQTYKPHSVLEIGIGHHALSTRVWLEFTTATLTTIDKGDWGQNSEPFKLKYGDRFTFISGRSEEVMPTLTDKFDLIFIDGDHAYDGVKADITNAIPLLEAGGIILLDDYGVDFISAMDIEDGKIIDGNFGVKQAADEVLVGWQPVYTTIPFANGGRAYALNGRVYAT